MIRESGHYAALRPQQHPRSCESRLPNLLQRRRKAPTRPSNNELLLADAVSEFNACQRDCRGPEGLKSQHRSTPPEISALIEASRRFPRLG